MAYVGRVEYTLFPPKSFLYNLLVPFSHSFTLFLIHSFKNFKSFIISSSISSQ